MTVPVIAIDGPSGSGKGTVAKHVAKALGYHLLDSGALYRLTAIAAGMKGAALDDTDAVAAIAGELEVRFDSNDDGSERIWLANVDVTLEVRAESTGAGASTVAAIPEVREALFGRIPQPTVHKKRSEHPVRSCPLNHAEILEFCDPIEN